MFHPGATVEQRYWVVVDHIDNVIWVYDRISCNKMFVGEYRDAAIPHGAG